MEMELVPQRPAKSYTAADVTGFINPDRLPLCQMGIGHFRGDRPCIPFETLLSTKAHQSAMRSDQITRGIGIGVIRPERSTCFTAIKFQQTRDFSIQPSNSEDAGIAAKTGTDPTAAIG